MRKLSLYSLSGLTFMLADLLRVEDWKRRKKRREGLAWYRGKLDLEITSYYKYNQITFFFVWDSTRKEEIIKNSDGIERYY